MRTSVLHFTTEDHRSRSSTGSIHLFKECTVAALDSTQQLQLDPALLIAEKEDLEFALPPEKCLLCIPAVPSFMVPHDLLHFLSPSLTEVKAVATLRHAGGTGLGDHESFLVLLEMTSPEAAAVFIREYHGSPLCSLQPVTCLVYSAGNCEEKTGSSSSSDCESDVCVLCLAPLDPEMPLSFTTCCRHTFHIACTRRLESPLCPVCRHQMDDSGLASLSSCAVCHWPRTPLPAPPLPSLQEQEQEQWGGYTAEESWSEGRDQDLWVCLVCGFIGCGEVHRVGVTSHIREHYQEQLHAYAMNTETRSVWDFAGEGYVHRLILNQQEQEQEQGSCGGSGTGPLISSSSSSSDGRETSSTAAMKIVEVPLPPSGGQDCQWSRSQVPPLSQQQEEFVVNRKLESAAGQYSAVLASRLEQQREQFESRLRRLRALSSDRPDTVTGTGDGSTGGSVAPSSRARQILHSLRSEKHKLMRQTELAHTRLAATLEERAVLGALSSSLRQNQAEWERRAEEAAHLLQQAEDSYRTNVPLLERQVRALMLRLDDERAPSDSPSSSSPPPPSS